MIAITASATMVHIMVAAQRRGRGLDQLQRRRQEFQLRILPARKGDAREFDQLAQFDLAGFR